MGAGRFADQSSLARTRDAFTDTVASQLRQGSAALFRRESRSLRHDFVHDSLWLDMDLTPLPISKHAEASTKGTFDEKHRYGRQLARVHAAQYHETLFSRVDPGNQESSAAYVATLDAVESFLRLSAPQQQRTIEALSELATTCLIQDVMQMPGRLLFADGKLAEVQLNRQHPPAEHVACGLERLMDRRGHP